MLFLMGIDENLGSLKEFDEAFKCLEEFEKMMELIDKYPVKPSELLPTCLPYEYTNLSSYNF